MQTQMMISVAVFALLLSAVVDAVVSAKFHVMQKSVPREDFVRLSKSDRDVRHELVFAVKQRNIRELDEMLTLRSTPGSVLYQEWLSFDEVGQLTRNPTSATAVRDWLVRNQVEVKWTSTNSHYIKAHASIAVWERLLNTEFFLWEDKSRKGSMPLHHRLLHRAVEYSLPEDVKEHLSAVFNTVQTPPVFKPKYRMRDVAQFRTDLKIEKVDPAEATANAAGATDGKVTVAFLNSFYKISSNNGSAQMQQSVFETAEESYSPTDLTIFQTNFSLPIQSALHPYGFNTTHCTGSTDCYEGNLDVQYIMGVAQQTATIYWYVTDNSTTDPFVAWVADVANMTNPPLVNSMSWGSIEQANSPDVMDAFNTEALKLTVMGVTVTVSSGDDGVASQATLCNANSGSAASDWPYASTWTGTGYFPSFPATSPYVTAVGATMGPEKGSPEIVCQSQLGGVITSGGGFSTYNPQPSWQTAAVNGYFAGLSTAPQAGYNALGRGYPDVSMIGVEYQVVVQGAMVALFGTSASSPVLAAMVSLTNAARRVRGKPPLGFLNPTLWAYGTENTFGPGGTSYNPYNDITSGNNKCVAYSGPNPSRAHCCTSGFTAAKGWDPTTGFGSLNYTSLGQMFETQFIAPSEEPTCAPTAVPSRPTAVPTAHPTKPTAMPTARPTRTPTRVPTYKPTSAPTAPTAQPTLVPTSGPSAAPSLSPSQRPSNIPTERPSVVPSAAPTDPTAGPTPSPSRLPTDAPVGSVAPSAQPSAPPSPIVSFSSNITLAGLTSPVLDLPSQLAVVQTTAGAMGVPVSAVSYLGTAAAPPAVNAAVTADAGRNLRFTQGVETTTRSLQSTYSVIAITFTQIALSDTTYTDTTSLYNGVTSSLQTSVSTGVYSTALRENAAALNATTVEAAEATSTASSPPTVVSADSSGGGDNNPLQNGGVLAGVVIGIFIVVALVCTALAYLVRGKASFATTSTASNAGGADKDFAVTDNPVFVRKAAPSTEL